MHTLNDMPALSEQLKNLREQKDSTEDILSGINQKIDELKSQIIVILETNKMDKFPAPCGITIGLRNEFSVKQPDSVEDEAAFNSWLADNDLDNLRKVNYQTLNSLYRERIEAAAEQGEIVTIPGLPAPTTRVTVTVRKG